MCSDHIEPWSARQGHSGFAWSWLGAALATTGLRFGVVTAPGQRYHPAIIAHASATLADMFPGRFWMAPGSGEYMNEHITGQAWPPKETRQRRLEECVEIIRRLHAGDVVTHHGLVTVEQARIWDVPETKPPIIAPAVSVETARRAAAWADGLVTVNQPHAKLKDMLGGVPERRWPRAGRPPGPPVLGADRGRGRRDRRGPVAHQRLCSADSLGPAHGGPFRRCQRRRRGGPGPERREHLRGHRAARAVAAPNIGPRLRRAVPALRRSGAGAVHPGLRRTRPPPAPPGVRDRLRPEREVRCENRRDLGPLVEERGRSTAWIRRRSSTATATAPEISAD